MAEDKGNCGRLDELRGGQSDVVRLDGRRARVKVFRLAVCLVCGGVVLEREQRALLEMSLQEGSVLGVCHCWSEPRQ